MPSRGARVRGSSAVAKPSRIVTNAARGATTARQGARAAARSTTHGAAYALCERDAGQGAQRNEGCHARHDAARWARSERARVCHVPPTHVSSRVFASSATQTGDAFFVRQTCLQSVSPKPVRHTCLTELLWRWLRAGGHRWAPMRSSLVSNACPRLLRTAATARARSRACALHALGSFRTAGAAS